VGALAAGASLAPAATTAIYSDTVPGTYFLQACADGAGLIQEPHEDNNCFTTTAKITVLDTPNLLVSAISDPPSKGGQGHPFDMTDTVKNTGAVSAGQSSVKYFLVSAADGTRTDLKGGGSVPALDAGLTFTDQETVTVRPETLPGTYHTQGCADSGKAVVE